MTEQQPLDETPRVEHDFGTKPMSNFSDTFFGPRDKKYLDFIARQTTQLRGTNAWYYVLRSQTRRMDGDRPISDAPGATPLDRTQHAGGNTVDEAEGISALYGEPLVVGTRLDSTRREVTPTWDYSEPIAVRGIVKELRRSENPDPRGTNYVRGARYDLARVLCEEEWGISPQPGDVVRLPNLMGSTNQTLQYDDSYYDVESVEPNMSRFGSTGFYTVFTLTLNWQSKYDPTRKFPDRIIRPQLEPPV